MDEDEEILTLIPLKNTLSVVFRYVIEGFELNDIKYKSLLYRYKIYITI
jgi:hypothetical protein